MQDHAARPGSPRSPSLRRRELVAAGLGALVAAACRSTRPARPRDLFPLADEHVFLDAAGGTPLSRFTEAGLRRYEAYWRLGPGGGRGEAVTEALSETRAAFARLVGARPGEIAFVPCTKAGEQIVLDGLPALRSGGNVVTNDMHFAGSLHNLVGLRRAGMDVRIVRAVDWDVPLEAMAAAIDERTALVAVTLVSNVNGRVEPLPELAEIAHAQGAHVYADIIQAAGIVPLDLRALGVDFAACSGYKWLFGPHGAGFFWVREELQGTALPDHLFPGHAVHNYEPWVAAPDPDAGEFVYRPPQDAQRYQPGHVSYLGYSALRESLRFIESLGVENLLRHSVRLNRRLVEGLDPERYELLSPHADRSPIVSFRTRVAIDLGESVRAKRVAVAGGGAGFRVSPAIYNDESDIDRLLEALNG